jgi:hypothetical protein
MGSEDYAKSDIPYLMRLTMVETFVTTVWFLAKILDLGEPSHENQSPNCSVRLAAPLMLKIFS